MQSALEKKGIELRSETIIRNDYAVKDEYSAHNSDAIGNGDPRGKGKGKLGGGPVGHTHTTPDSNKSATIDYSTFDTTGGGGLYDIEGYQGKGGRNFLVNISKYNSEYEYGINLIDTSANKGQVKF